MNSTSQINKVKNMPENSNPAHACGIGAGKANGTMGNDAKQEIKGKEEAYSFFCTCGGYSFQLQAGMRAEEVEMKNAYFRETYTTTARSLALAREEERMAMAQIELEERAEKVHYRKGETVKCDKWSEEWTEECAGGIHFFITRLEAENY